MALTSARPMRLTARRYVVYIYDSLKFAFFRALGRTAPALGCSLASGSSDPRAAGPRLTRYKRSRCYAGGEAYHQFHANRVLRRSVPYSYTATLKRVQSSLGRLDSMGC